MHTGFIENYIIFVYKMYKTLLLGFRTNREVRIEYYRFFLPTLAFWFYFNNTMS